MVKVVLRAPFAYDADAVSLENGLACDPDESKTQQSAEAECNINEIVRRFGLTGEMPENFVMPQWGVDATGALDFHAAMNAVREAEAAFMTLPAEVRVRFGHDPGSLMSFLEDEKNRDEALKLGLLAKPPEKTRDVVQAVDELAQKLVVPKP